MRLSLRILAVALLVNSAALLPFVVSCVRIKGGCIGMTVTPDSFSAKIGKSRTFTADVDGTPSDDCTFAFSDAGAGTLVDLGVENATKLVLTASTGIYLLRVTSVDDAARFCNVAVNVSNFGFAGSNPVTITGVSADFFVGDVAIGGSGAHSFVASAAATDSSVYAAFFQTGSVNDDTIRRYSLAQLLSGNGTPQYDIFAQGFPPGFYLPAGDPPRPRLAADGQGNCYWLRNGQTLEIARLRSGLVAGQTPSPTGDVVSFNTLAIQLDARSDLTSDPAGNLYVVGESFAGLGSVHALGFPATANILRIHDAFGPNPVVTVVTPTPITVQDDISLAADNEGRVLVATHIAGVGAVGQLFRLRSNGGLDTTFTPPQLNVPFDVKVDGEGAIYAIENRAGTARVLVLNEFGAQVAVIPPTAAPGPLQLQSVLGFASSGNGTLAIFDDLQGPTEPPASFVLVNPN